MVRGDIKGILHDWTCEYKQKFPDYRKERRREEGLRERGKAKAMYVQKEVTLNFFDGYCSKTRDLDGPDAAMVSTFAGGAQMNPHCRLSLLGSGPQAADWGLTWLHGQGALIQLQWLSSLTLHRQGWW